MKGKTADIISAIMADQIITAGPVVYALDIMAAMKTPWMVHWSRTTVILDNLVKNSSWAS